MKLITLSTGSKGNCYILMSNNGKFCVLDCGLKLKSITSHPEFTTFADLDFMFSTHEHKDHSLSLEDFKLCGCEIVSYENADTTKNITIGQWRLRLFHVKHNAVNYGIIIHDTVENKTICYATDFIEMPKIKNVDYWLYEINYDDFTVDRIIESQDISKIHVANNIQHHNSLEYAEQYFTELGNKPKLIVACHTSNMGGTPERIKAKMKSLCDRIEVAKRDLVVEF